jgi:hypothetical protein
MPHALFPFIHIRHRIPSTTDSVVRFPTLFSVLFLHKDLKVPAIREKTKFIVKYRDKITAHPNEIASTLLEKDEERRKMKKIQIKQI